MLTPGKLEVGYSLTRKRRERGYRREELTRFGRIPSDKATLICSKPIPHISLPFKEVMADVLKVKPPQKEPKRKASGSEMRGGRKRR
jgi:hypothetical protein